MPQKIVLKKFGIVSIRIVTTHKPRHSNRLFSANQYNFKSNWLCKSCSKIFRLKSNRKFKTLREYDLCCPKCQSNNITHSNELSGAINNNLPLSEILKKFKGQDMELEFTLDNKSKYFAMVIS
jgi:hypothetical protein